jgi:uncharacterized lipoprotein YddW (UPF0748 family)
LTAVFSVFRSLLAGLLILLVIGVDAERRPQRGGREGRSGEVRGLWVVRTSLASPASIAEMVRTAADAGINALFVQVRGRGDAYYRSSLEPRGALLAPRPTSFDPLAAVIREAGPRGIAVHAWINVGLVSDAVNLTQAPEHIIRAHPEWLMLPRALAAPASRRRPRDPRYLNALTQWTRANTAHVEGLYVSPIPREARVHAAAVAREVANRYDIDGMHLDYVRYPNEGFDYSPQALAEFRASLVGDLNASELAALDGRADASPAVFADRYPERWENFRRARVTALVAGMADAARQARPGIIISAAVLPDPDAAMRDKLQDWPAWTARRLVDAICPMAYAEDRATFTKQVQATHRAAGAVPVWTGIGAYRLTAAETASRIREARKTGSAGVLLFSYDSISSGLQRRRYLTSVARAAFGVQP